MNAVLQFAASFAAGALLGTVFFWSLWLTVEGLARARHPALRMITSLLLRIGLVLAGFFLIAHYGDWLHLLVAAAGFTLPRLLMVRRVWLRSVGKEPNA